MLGYEHMHGVLKVKEESEMCKIMEHYIDFEPNPELLEQQMHNTLAQTLKANHYKFVAEQSDISTEESITNLVQLITSKYQKN